MDSSISEEAGLSAADAELPDMVPVSIRTTLPEFSHCRLEKVLAGVLLTWEEFLQLFDIRANPTDYFIRGSNGMKQELSQRIIDYVNTFKKKLKIYPVTLERVNGANDACKGQRLSVTSDNSTNFSNDTEAQSTAATVDEQEVKSISSYASTAKKLAKLIDTDRRKKAPRKAKESLSKIAENVIHSHSQSVPTGSSTKRTNSSAKKAGTKRKLQAKSVSPPNLTADGISADNPDGQEEMSAESDLPPSASTSKLPLERAKPKRISATDHRQSRDSAIAIPSSSVKKGRKSRQKPSIVEDKRRSRSSRSTKESDSSDESSSSQDEEDPPRGKKKLLKKCVIKYLTEKVSPRSFLRLRQELQALRDQEKYFKVTSVVPMTAGMMEQTFCRKTV